MPFRAQGNGLKSACAMDQGHKSRQWWSFTQCSDRWPGNGLSFQPHRKGSYSTEKTFAHEAFQIQESLASEMSCQTPCNFLAHRKWKSEIWHYWNSWWVQKPQFILDSVKAANYPGMADPAAMQVPRQHLQFSRIQQYFHSSQFCTWNNFSSCSLSVSFLNSTKRSLW